MRLGSQTYKMYLTLTIRFTDDICFTCVKDTLISRSHFGAQKIYYTQNNHNEFNFMES